MFSLVYSKFIAMRNIVLYSVSARLLVKIRVPQVFWEPIQNRGYISRGLAVPRISVFPCFNS